MSDYTIKNLRQVEDGVRSPSWGWRGAGSEPQPGRRRL